jgi:DNA-binding NarL/FixJ family response regulator
MDDYATDDAPELSRILRQTLMCLAAGLREWEIAEHCECSDYAAHERKRELFKKLHVHNGGSAVNVGRTYKLYNEQEADLLRQRYELKRMSEPKPVRKKNSSKKKKGGK